MADEGDGGDDVEWLGEVLRAVGAVGAVGAVRVVRAEGVWGVNSTTAPL